MWTASSARAWTSALTAASPAGSQARTAAGPEKATRLREWLDGNGLPHAELWAYGDSSGDDDLLAIADHPVSVRRVRVTPEPAPADLV